MSRSFRKTGPIAGATKEEHGVSNIRIKSPQKINGPFSNCLRCFKGEMVITSGGRTKCKRIPIRKAYF